jgi:hypothetical protein
MEITLALLHSRRVGQARGHGVEYAGLQQDGGGELGNGVDPEGQGIELDQRVLFPEQPTAGAEKDLVEAVKKVSKSMNELAR